MEDGERDRSDYGLRREVGVHMTFYVLFVLLTSGVPSVSPPMDEASCYAMIQIAQRDPDVVMVSDCVSVTLHDKEPQKTKL